MISANRRAANAKVIPFGRAWSRQNCCDQGEGGHPGKFRFNQTQDNIMNRFVL